MTHTHPQACTQRGGKNRSVGQSFNQHMEFWCVGVDSGVVGTRLAFLVVPPVQDSALVLWKTKNTHNANGQGCVADVLPIARLRWTAAQIHAPSSAPRGLVVPCLVLLPKDLCGVAMGTLKNSVEGAFSVSRGFLSAKCREPQECLHPSQIVRCTATFLLAASLCHATVSLTAQTSNGVCNCVKAHRGGGGAR